MLNPQVVKLLGKDSEGRPYWNGYGLTRIGVPLGVGFEVSQTSARPNLCLYLLPYESGYRVLSYCSSATPVFSPLPSWTSPLKL